jgi:hypothetical protein
MREGYRMAWAILLLALLVGSTRSAVAHDLTEPALPGGPTDTAFLLERALALQRLEGPAAAWVVEAFVAEQYTHRLGPIDLCFWDGTATDRAHFAAVATSWAEGTGISLRWQNAGAANACPATGFEVYPLRVSLGNAASLEPDDKKLVSWGRVGRLGSESGRKVTIYISPFESATGRDYVIRHEVGHALGFLHEL